MKKASISSAAASIVNSSPAVPAHVVAAHEAIEGTEKPRKIRLNLDLPADLHRQFKTQAANEGKKMTDIVMAYIQNYVSK